MSNIRTYPQALSIMDNSNFVCWELYELQGFNKTLSRGTQYDDNMSLNDSKAALETAVRLYSSHNPNVIFSLTLRKAKTSNGNGVIPELYFSVNDMYPAANQMGLGNVQQMQQPQNFQEMIDFAIEKATFKMKLDFERKEFEREKQDLKEREKEINELEKKYTSESNKYAAGFEKGVGLLAMKILFPGENQTANNKEIGDVTTELVEESEASERDKILDDIDDILSESEASESDLAQIKNMLPHLLEKLKEEQNG